jgi:hypothetical protein
VAVRGRPAGDEVKQLAWELRFVIPCTLGAVFNKNPAKDEKEYHILARIVQAARPDSWADDPTRALRLVMRTAVAELPDKEHPKFCTMTWREIGETLCGFRHVAVTRENSHMKLYSRYYDVMRHQFDPPVDDNHLKRHVVRPLRSKLAAILLDPVSKISTDSGEVGLETDVFGTKAATQNVAAWAASQEAKQAPGDNVEIHGSRSEAETVVPKAIVVQNKYATGPSSLLEDRTYAYLSTSPEPYCAERGCKVEGTDMKSGARLVVTCWCEGAEMTNRDTTSPGIEQNPHGVTSKLWYWGVWPDGRAGYLSEVYVEPQYRGGLGLPRCET